jgi:polyhydroxyalkanoate synthesis regulator protein
LLQVISDQEQYSDAMMSEDFLAQIIRCYGKVAPGLVASHLEQSLRQFLAQSQNISINEAAGNFLTEIKNSLTSGP